jgi:hypothetical protein
MELAPLDGQIVDLKMYGSGDWLPGLWAIRPEYEPMWWAWFRGEARPVRPTAWRALTDRTHLSDAACGGLPAPA